MAKFSTPLLVSPSNTQWTTTKSFKYTTDAQERAATNSGLKAGGQAVADRYVGSPGAVVEKTVAAGAGAVAGRELVLKASAAATTRLARTVALEAAPKIVAGKALGGVVAVASTIGDVVDFAVAYNKGYNKSMAEMKAKSSAVTDGIHTQRAE